MIGRQLGERFGLAGILFARLHQAPGLVLGMLWPAFVLLDSLFPQILPVLVSQRCEVVWASVIETQVGTRAKTTELATSSCQLSTV